MPLSSSPENVARWFTIATGLPVDRRAELDDAVHVCAAP